MKSSRPARGRGSPSNPKNRFEAIEQVAHVGVLVEEPVGPQRIAQNQPALRIGVIDLDGEPTRGLVNVAGFGVTVTSAQAEFEAMKVSVTLVVMSTQLMVQLLPVYE